MQHLYLLKEAFLQHTAANHMMREKRKGRKGREEERSTNLDTKPSWVYVCNKDLNKAVGKDGITHQLLCDICSSAAPPESFLCSPIQLAPLETKQHETFGFWEINRDAGKKRELDPPQKSRKSLHGTDLLDGVVFLVSSFNLLWTAMEMHRGFENSSLG